MVGALGTLHILFVEMLPENWSASAIIPPSALLALSEHRERNAKYPLLGTTWTNFVAAHAVVRCAVMLNVVSDAATNGRGCNAVDHFPNYNSIAILRQRLHRRAIRKADAHEQR
jgi:hypothetical protein